MTMSDPSHEPPLEPKSKPEAGHFEEGKDRTWMWFAVPFALVIVAVVAFVLLTDPESGSPFGYTQ